jgi:hypothetical protein
LDLNDRFRARQLRLQPGVLAPEGGEFLGERVGAWFRPPLLRGEGLQLPSGAQPAPLGELRRVQAFAAEQGADLTRLGTGIRLLSPRRHPDEQRWACLSTSG